MDKKKDSSFLESLVGEAKVVSKRVLEETSKTYQSFRTNLDIVNLKKRRKERAADLGYKVFLMIKEGKLTVPGVEYIISELKALDFQIKLKEEDLIEIAAADPGSVVKTEPDAIVPDDEKEVKPAKKAAAPKAAKKAPAADVKTVRLDLVEKKADAASKADISQASSEELIQKLVAVKGIGDKTAIVLIEAGISTVTALANADSEKLGEILNRAPKAAQKLIENARNHLATS